MYGFLPVEFLVPMKSQNMTLKHFGGGVVGAAVGRGKKESCIPQVEIHLQKYCSGYKPEYSGFLAETWLVKAASTQCWVLSCHCAVVIIFSNILLSA